MRGMLKNYFLMREILYQYLLHCVWPQFHLVNCCPLREIGHSKILIEVKIEVITHVYKFLRKTNFLLEVIDVKLNLISKLGPRQSSICVSILMLHIS